MELIKAKEIADKLVNLLTPYSKIINIAGSIRREKPEVKDIEIVCLPKKVQGGQVDIFDESPQDMIVSTEFIRTVYSLGTVLKGKATGRYMQIVLPEGINLDLFIPEESDFFRQYVIRTGSGDYSHKVIATGWKKFGWVGSDLGLRKMSDCVETKLPDGKSKWKCVKPNAELPPVWTSEEHFFEWLGIKWIDPTLRNY